MLDHLIPFCVHLPFCLSLQDLLQVISNLVDEKSDEYWTYLNTVRVTFLFSVHVHVISVSYCIAQHQSCTYNALCIM